MNIVERTCGFGHPKALFSTSPDKTKIKMKEKIENKTEEELKKKFMKGFKDAQKNRRWFEQGQAEAKKEFLEFLKTEENLYKAYCQTKDKRIKQIFDGRLLVIKQKIKELEDLK